MAKQNLINARFTNKSDAELFANNNNAVVLVQNIPFGGNFLEKAYSFSIRYNFHR